MNTLSALLFTLLLSVAAAEDTCASSDGRSCSPDSSVLLQSSMHKELQEFLDKDDSVGEESTEHDSIAEADEVLNAEAAEEESEDEDAEGDAEDAAAAAEEAKDASLKKLKQPKTIVITFGGAKHKDSSSGMRHEFFDRPEFVKTHAWTGPDSPLDCDKRSACWHGEGSRRLPGSSRESLGNMKIDVPAGMAYSKYTAEFWLQCDSTNTKAKLQICATEPVNGWFTVLFDGINVKDDKNFPGWKPWPGCAERGFPTSFEKSLIKNPPTRVVLQFTPKDNQKESGVRARVLADGVDPIVDTCMSAKDCLNVLGGESSNAFELRNSNDMQLTCLKADYDSMTEGEKKVCIKWGKCLKLSGKKDEILAFLAAGMVTGLSLTGLGINEAWNMADASLLADAGAIDPAGCKNPVNEDPESWDCECAPGMIAACEKRGQGESLQLQGCFRDLMCENEAICPSWKATRCPGFLNEQGSDATKVESKVHPMAVENATMDSGNANEGVPASLEESLSGKRTC